MRRKIKLVIGIIMLSIIPIGVFYLFILTGGLLETIFLLAVAAIFFLWIYVGIELLEKNK